MRLQQLRYLIAVAESGSINSVAHSHYISQSALSTSIRELEEEMGVKVFNRTNKGITLTSEGVELLAYARQVVEQADLMIRHYESDRNDTYRKLSVSSQHYAFVVNAFTEFVAKRHDESCDFTLRETRTADVIDDVRTFRSDIGVLFLSTYNERVLRRRLDEANLRFVSLFRARPHVFVREGHPLATRKSLRVQDLEDYPRYTFEQGPEGSLYYSEEPLSSLPHRQRITVSDRATMTSLLRCYDGFLVSTGVRSDEMLDGIVAIPLDVDEVMNVGYVVHRERKLSSLAQAYIAELNQLIMGCMDKNALVPSKEVTRAVAGDDKDAASEAQSAATPADPAE